MFSISLSVAVCSIVPCLPLGVSISLSVAGCSLCRCLSLGVLYVAVGRRCDAVCRWVYLFSRSVAGSSLCRCRALGVLYVAVGRPVTLSAPAGNAKPSGIAVDWVADHLYWTQVDRSGSKPRGAVVTSTTDGRYKRSLIATGERGHQLRATDGRYKRSLIATGERGHRRPVQAQSDRHR